MADNVTTTDLETALKNLADSLGLSVKEYVEGGFLDLSTYGVDKAGILARLDALDKIDSSDNVETLAEKVASLDAMFTENGNLATDVLNRIATNATAIGSVQTDLTNFKSDVASEQDVQKSNIAANTTSISNLSDTVTANKTAADAALADLQTSVASNTADVSTLKGDDTVAGSVANVVKTETTRAKAAEAAEITARDAAIATAKTDATTAAKTYTDNTAAKLQSSIDTLETASTDGAAALAAVHSELDATQTGLGLNTDGSFTPVDGTDSLEEYVQDVSGDANTLKKALRKVARKAKQADTAIETKIDTEIAARGAAETDLQNQIDAIAGDGTSSLSGLESRISAAEDVINDTTDADGNLVKGLASKANDTAAALVAEATARATEAAQNLADAKAYADSKDIKAASMDIASISNTFRTTLGLGAQSAQSAQNNSGL